MAQVPLLIIVGPSGVGKSTLYRMLLDEFPKSIQLSISYTTREIRAGEQHGVHYYYISNEDFDRRKAAEEFLECACYVGNQYGTSMEEIRRIRQNGMIPMLEIDINGYKQVMQKGIPVNGVFVTVNDSETLRNRLYGRGADQSKEIARRLDRAMQEVEESKNCPFSMILVNDELQSAYAHLREQVKKWYPDILGN